MTDFRFKPTFDRYGKCVFCGVMVFGDTASHKCKLPLKVRAALLRIGDKVQAFDGPFGSAIVTNVTETDVMLFRPYGTSEDFLCSGGVIPYIGIEQFSLSRSAGGEFTIWERKELK